MTLKNKKNHYNVKLLRGDDVSISLKNSKLVLKNGQDDITGKSEKEEWFIINLPYEKIVISGKGYISTEAISLLNQNNRNVVLVDTYGHPVSLIKVEYFSNALIRCSSDLISSNTFILICLGIRFNFIIDLSICSHFFLLK